MDHHERFEIALQTADPVEALRSLALALHAEGCRRKQIVEVFHGFYCTLQEQGREREEDLVGDVIDMISGCFAGRNLEFPNEK